jgi:PmbA protein
METGTMPKGRPVLVPERDEAALLESCTRLCAEARSVGADEAEVFAARRATVAVRFEKGDLKLVQVDEGSSLGLRAFKDHKLGFSSTNQEGEASLQATAKDALMLAEFSPADEHNQLAIPSGTPVNYELVDPEVANMSVEDAVARATDFVARVKAIDPRLSIDQVELETSSGVHAIHSIPKSGKGAHAAESDAVLSISVFGMAIEGEDVGGFHYNGDIARNVADFDVACEAALKEFGEVALGNLGSGRAESYQGPVLFSPYALLSMFISPLVSASSAIAVQRERSALAGKLGTEVASTFLNVLDDPTDKTLGGCGTFDREGQPTARFPLVENGVLQGWMYNGYAASVDGVTSTGHAAGGARSTPGLGSHAIKIAGAGELDQNGLMKELGKGLYVGRFSGTVDPASGDFSGVAKSARWVEDGEIVRPVRETLLSGNAFELLHRIVAFSKDAERCMGSSMAPFALIDGVSVTAG